VGKIESRMKAMGKKLESMIEKSGDNQVEEYLRQVRILAGRPKFTQAHILFTALETLVDIAFRTSLKMLIVLQSIYSL
jgi:hypothetical protein